MQVGETAIEEARLLGKDVAALEQQLEAAQAAAGTSAADWEAAAAEAADLRDQLQQAQDASLQAQNVVNQLRAKWQDAQDRAEAAEQAQQQLQQQLQALQAQADGVNEGQSQQEAATVVTLREQLQHAQQQAHQHAAELGEVTLYIRNAS